MDAQDRYRPDEFFTGVQIRGVKVLLKRWRIARDTGQTLPVEDQANLDRLIGAELKGMIRRTRKMCRETN